MLASQQPDLILVKGGKVAIFELTVTTSRIREALESKVGQYYDLATIINWSGVWSCRYDVVGFLADGVVPARAFRALFAAVMAEARVKDVRSHLRKLLQSCLQKVSEIVSRAGFDLFAMKRGLSLAH